MGCPFSLLCCIHSSWDASKQPGARGVFKPGANSPSGSDVSYGDVEFEAGHIYPDEIISIPRAPADLTLIERLDYYFSQLLEKAIPTAIKESWKNPQKE